MNYRRLVSTHATAFACLVAAGACSPGMTVTNPGDAGAVPAVGGADLSTSAATPDLADPDSVTIALSTFKVPAGGETFKCQNFKNPFGADAEVRLWESHMAPGSHHLLVFYKDNLSDGPLADCSGLEFDASPYSAQTPDATIGYPDGVAALMPAGKGLRLASHYLNTTPNEITAEVRLTIHKARPGTVTAHAGVYFFLNPNIFLKPSPDPQQVTQTCTLKQDMTVLYALGHMHRHATNMTATVDGMPLYATDSWDNSPFQPLMPSVALKAGQKITYTCTFLNNTNGYLTFGESARTNEMCIFEGQFYPAPDGVATIGCN